MSRTRDLLHKNSLADFKAWLVSDGWTIEPPKGEYEVLRARKPNHSAPVVFYLKLPPTEHVTTFGLGTGLVKQFLRTKHASRRSILTFPAEIEVES